MKLYYLIFAGTLLAFLGSVGCAAITQLACYDEFGNPLSPDVWDFNYGSQILTIREEQYSVLDDPYLPASYIRVIGSAQGPSTFSIVEEITNMSTIHWTGYKLVYGVNHADDVTSFVLGSITTDTFKEVPYAPGLPYGASGIFSGGSVLPGETLTIQYELFTDSPGTNFVVGGAPIPEPGSIFVLGCGALMLSQKRRYARTAK